MEPTSLAPLAPAAVLPAWHAALLWAPTLLLAATALSLREGRDAVTPAWRRAQAAVLAVLALALAGVAALAAAGPAEGLGVRADVPGAAVLALVGFVGWVIVRYAARYLGGQDGQVRHARWLLATLAAVTLVVVTDHLLMLALAWAAASLSLHRLLTFFAGRPAARLAAHKKAVTGRIADALMLGAVLLLLLGAGSERIGALQALAAGAAPLPASAQAAVLLITLAAILKCAQLPFHGWLIQVMEAPTHVSALLHAGVVNLGGLVLIRIAPLLSETPAAQALLVAVGLATAVLAALVATTRISVKVALAWSTCAQMGFMLLQCGLGLYGMALVHLLAHSLYKAHAFLAAGGVVRSTLAGQLVAPMPRPGAGGLALGALLGVTAVAVAGSAWGADAGATPALWVMAGVVALALVPLLHGRALALGGAWPLGLAAGALGIALAWFGLHAAVEALPGPQATAASVHPALWIGTAAAFAALFALQTALALAPEGALARRLYPWFYGGLFLDEVWSRALLRLVPPPARAGVDSNPAKANAHIQGA